MFQVAEHGADDFGHHANNFADTFFGKLFNDEVVDLDSEFIQYLNLGERYVYRGSLTTTPFTESILWNVLPEVITISPETMSFFDGTNIRV